MNSFNIIFLGWMLLLEIQFEMSSQWLNIDDVKVMILDQMV